MKNLELIKQALSMAAAKGCFNTLELETINNSLIEIEKKLNETDK